MTNEEKNELVSSIKSELSAVLTLFLTEPGWWNDSPGKDRLRKLLIEIDEKESFLRDYDDWLSIQIETLFKRCDEEKVKIIGLPFRTERCRTPSRLTDKEVACYWKARMDGYGYNMLFNERVWLKSYRFFCPECLTWQEGGFQNVDGGRVMCSKCIRKKNLRRCMYCGTWIEPSGAELICSSCKKEANRAMEHLYGDARVLRWKRVDSDAADETIFYGIENEVEHVGCDSDEREETCRKIENILPNWFFYKYDGSLERGLEFNSAPATYKALMAKRGKMAEIFDMLRNMDALSGDDSRCGLHIHINLDAFKEDRQKRNFMMAIEGNPFLFKYLSRRSAGSLNRWSSIRSLSNCYDLRSMDVAGRQLKIQSWDRDSRYQAINLTARCKGTLEVRLFKGTLGIRTWLGSVQIIHALMLTTRAYDEDCRIMEPWELENTLIQNHMSDGLYLYERAKSRVSSMYSRIYDM